MEKNRSTKAARKGLGQGLRRLLVTSALPYANGPIHLGHLVETIQTDIWVRFQKYSGNEAYYFCADDTHGTPVMIAAKKAGKTPEEFVAEIQREHLRDFQGFQIQFDNYYSTNSPENKALSEQIYEAAKKKGNIDRKTIRQLYSEEDGMFLPDRFVKGTCPKCKSPDQYGDSCEVCGSTYSPTELIDPRSALSGAVPVLKDSEHLFFKLGDYQTFLEKWLAKGVSTGIKRKLDEWLKDGLRDWDISRDGPYFGFAIPGEKDKYFYVWLDAPVGYMASSKNFFDRTKRESWDSFWKKPGSEIHHFLGKDIVYFHTLFWPALLEAGGFQKPDQIHVHGFLTINGEKMSKSRGTLVRGSTYLKFLEPEALRYFYASKLGSGLDDLDLSRDDFISRWNADVVGNITNIFSRLCGGIAPKLDGKLGKLSKEGKALKKAALETAAKTAKFFEALEYAKAMREIASLADSINRLIAEKEPWKLIKTDPEQARTVVTDALCSARILASLLKPVLPSFVAGVENLLNLKEELTLANLDYEFPSGHTIHPYRNLAARIDEKEFEAMLEEEKKLSGTIQPAKTPGPGASPSGNAKPDEKKAEAKSSGIITIDDLTRVHLRAGKILKAELVEGADKLLRIELDLGEAEPRQVFAGIRAAYQPEELIGLTVAAVANLQPRKMKFGISSAMLLASGEGAGLSLYVAHRSAKPGDLLK
ncbi:MAG: methionine--tRNA ligase [Leptospirales bacterium]|nr:methionine--tRNA ligase [Leptospirales bacterium]